MLKRFVHIIGGDPNRKQIDEFSVIVDQINELEDQYEKVSEEEIGAKTREFRLRLAKGESLDDILPEAYAVVREASKRTSGLRHYDVQMIGGIALHKGIIAEMKTGEGKTLVATLPLYLNALNLNPEWVSRARRRWGENPEAWEFRTLEGILVGRGTHLITVNDYLARRDARWKAPIYIMLGLSVGVLQMASRTEHGRKAFLVDLERESPHEDQHQLQMVDRKLAYDADITYGTNSEFGFDYLRDNMKMNMAERVQRGHHYAIIDEVDNVLIDEARTPLIISGPAAEATEWYVKMAQIVHSLRPEDYELNEKDRNVTLTEVGEVRVEELLGMALRDPERPEDVTPEQARLLGYLEQALLAEFLYKRNKEYIVQGGKVVIVDDFTGRLMPGRRWSDGLHQAVEAKEGARVEAENITYATITIQNYFRMYEKLAGMTGTALTEAEEFDKIYNLGVLAIPTNLEYQAERRDAPLVALEARDEDGYKYTYYAHQDDPEQKQAFWKRKDYPDVIYRTEEAKLRAVVREILTYHVIGRPMLVGTTSVELSERVSGRLKAEPVRRLVQTLLIRDAWFAKHDHVEDGRAVEALEPLNTPLDQLRPTELRQMIREMELDLSLNPESAENLDRLLRILGLSASHGERLTEVLKGGIPHQVLNARKHTEESQIIAGAGAFGGVTIATNMAGRGVDIKLGGELAEEVLSSVNRVLRRAGYDHAYDMTLGERYQAVKELDPEDYGIYGSEIGYFIESMEDMRKVKELGGLHVIGSERHEARRIDNQLRGRSSRQGDPGSSRFYLSLEDELMVRFGGAQMEGMLSRLRVDDAMPIEHNLVSRIVESSQTRVEGANFDVRKHLLEYDDVLNTQRGRIYAQRDRVMVKDDLSEDVTGMLREEVTRRVPEALMDEGGPWKLLSWLDQIQPPLPLQKGLFPSYALKLLLDEITTSQESFSPAEAKKALLQLAADSVDAEHEHVIQSVTSLLEQSRFRMEDQQADHQEIFDTFMEGLELNEENESRNPQEIFDELTNLLHVPVKLSNAQIRSLRDDPEEVRELISLQVEKYIMGLAIARLIGAVERVLKESIGIEQIRMTDSNWDDLSKIVLDAIDNTFAQRKERMVGDGSAGQIGSDLDASLNRLGADSLSRDDLLSLMMILPQGRRAAFDKKTHRRVWVRTTRLTLIYQAAKLLEDREPEEIAEDVLAHLEAAQEAILQVWGQSEINRLGATNPGDLEESARNGVARALGEETYNAIQKQSFSALSSELQERVTSELGRQALTQIYRQLLLGVISELWVEYLTQMEALRVSIGLEAYAQRDPLVQYKSRAFEMFQNLLRDMRISVVTRMFTFRPRDLSSVQSEISREEAPPPAEEPQSAKQEASSKKKRRRRGRR
jgi:preprotein translocase subunit SecA